eukprot:1547205-Lingulodinium_polyedra.AAC.1
MGTLQRRSSRAAAVLTLASTAGRLRAHSVPLGCRKRQTQMLGSGRHAVRSLVDLRRGLTATQALALPRTAVRSPL